MRRLTLPAALIPDDLASTEDNSPFAVEGLFVP
jgi:hypothetical protein